MKNLTKFETLAYFTGATGVLLAFLLLEIFSIVMDFWGLLLIFILFIGFDISYFLAYRREKNVTVTK